MKGRGLHGLCLSDVAVKEAVTEFSTMVDRGHLDFCGTIKAEDEVKRIRKSGWSLNDGARSLADGELNQSGQQTDDHSGDPTNQCSEEH